MNFLSTLEGWFRSVSAKFWEMADGMPPVIKDALNPPTDALGALFGNIADAFGTGAAWYDSIEARIANFLSWDQIWPRIYGAWPWIWDPITYLWAGFRNIIFNAHPWLWDPITYLWAGFRTKILGAWSWLDTIDDKIRTVAWDFTRDRLWDFIELSFASAARVGYRILNAVWNLEWDEEKDEVK